MTQRLALPPSSPKPSLARWHRALPALLILAVLAGAALTAWRVSRASGAHQAAPARRIDWKHPVRVPGAGFALSGAGSPSTGDLLTPLARAGSTAQAVAPQADFPPCYQGTAYRVWVLENGVWNDVWKERGSTLEAWVQYLWCPRWSLDQVGWNFAYGRAYELAPGCRPIGFGNNAQWGWLGAMIGNYAAIVGDGERAVTYTVCQGQYGWDYSQLVRGDAIYNVGMQAFDVELNSLTYVWSPCCY